MPRCDHCLIEFPERETVRDGDRVFCCHGCAGVWRLIHDEGLDGFYGRRDGWAPGPAVTGQIIDESSFADALTPLPGGEMECDLVIDGIRCASCVWLNEKVLERTPGVIYARVNYATHRARVRFDPRETNLGAVLARIASHGYSPKPYSPELGAEERKAASRDLLIRFGTAAFFAMQLMIYSSALYAGYFQGIDPSTKNIFHYIELALATPAVFYSGWPFIKGAWRGIRNLAFNMDVLIATGTLAAYFYSIYQMTHGGEVYFDTSAMIVTFILLGRYIEAGAKGRASEAVSRLLTLHPKEARVVDPITGQRRMAPVEALKPGDLVEVIPGASIPIDGVVTEGASDVNEAMLTGEPVPVTKSAGAEAFAGTQNLYGSFVMRVTRTGRETMLQKIVTAVEDAVQRRARAQAVADRVVGVFVPAVLVIAAATLGVKLIIGVPVETALMHAVAVLVIACPCALGLATPLAIVVAATRGASKGILIKGGDVIEEAGAVDTVVLDKTGTVTEGKPVLVDHIGIGMDGGEALAMAAALEAKSEHAVGQAIARAVGGAALSAIEGFRAVPGGGVAGVVGSKPTAVGTREFLVSEGAGVTLDQEREAMIAEAESRGATVVYMAQAGALAAIFIVADRIKPTAMEAVAMLKRMGVRVVMLTGDHPSTAAAVARDVGISEVRARMTPVGKAEEVLRMRDEGRRVLMAGDGINDAPALVEAHVGLAMGRATDIALESADMVLIRDDLRLIPEAIRLTRRSASVIRQNLFWAFFYNIVTVPLAVVGVLHPIVAAGAMALSSLSVVGNSMRAR